MSRYPRYRKRYNIHHVISGIKILAFTFAVICIIALSISADVGQAKSKLGTLIMTKVYVNVMESGSSLVSYQAIENKPDSLMAVMLEQQFVMHEFTKGMKQDNVILTSSNPFTSPEVEPVEEDSNKIGFANSLEGKLTREYILTNGEVFDAKTFKENMKADISANTTTDDSMSVGVIEGDIYYEEEGDVRPGGDDSSIETMRTYDGNKFSLKQMKDINFLIRNFYIVDPSTQVTDSIFDAEVMLAKDMTIKSKNDAPQILIYHTHSQEDFVDSKPGAEKDTVVGIGTYLTKILEEQYGYNVIHDKSNYDMVEGFEERNHAYNYAKEGVQKILDENPTIEVIIDLHRDARKKRSIMLNGKETAQIMLFNGLSRNLNGPRTDLDNPNLQDNLAFSLQLQLKSLEKYPGLFYKNYLQSLRYNLHLMPKAILVELGTEENTVKSARNAMEPFADILDDVLQGK
ncbi:MAG TPA: stage II sporulation protein P [Mobilitalea sp.]|nr:stage II sporulation protein P [Mobilitalea sp.]